MDMFSPTEVKPLRSWKPLFDGDDNNIIKNILSSPTPLMVTPLGTIDDTYSTTTSPLLVVSSLRIVDETNNTTTPPSLIVSPFQSIISFDDTNKDSIDVDVGPTTGLNKRKRGRLKGSKNLKMTITKPKTYSSNSKVVTSCSDFNSGINEAERETGNQELADLVLMQFDAVRRWLCQRKCVKGVLTTVLTNCKNLGVRTDMKKRIGQVPEIQVSDIFYFWGEMCLFGLHTQMVAGIGYLTVKDDATEGSLATNVVTSGYYNDETEDLQTLIHTRHSGMEKTDQVIDQKLGRGNLALEASKRKENEVRVIRGEEDPNDKKKKIYIYNGLYLVSDYWKAKRKSCFEEFKFKLVRKPDQPSGYANWKFVKNWSKCGLDNSRKGLILKDLSYGVGTLPVPLLNEIDENNKERPKDFSYKSSSPCSSMTIFQNYQSTACNNCQGQLCEDSKFPCVQKKW